MSSTPPKPTGPTNELAKARNRDAAERTLAAWIRRSLSLIGFGFGFDQILEALGRSGLQERPVIDRVLVHSIGLAFVGLGLYLLMLAMGQYRLAIKSLQGDAELHALTQRFNQLITGSIVLFGILAMVAVLIRSTSP